MKALSNFLLVLLVAFSGGTSFAQKQGQAAIDSLLQVLSKAKQDTNRVELLAQISFDYHLIDPAEGIRYGMQGLALAEKLDWKKGIANVNTTLGVDYMSVANFPKALEYFQVALKQGEEMGDKNRISKVTGNMAIVYERQGNYAQALACYQKSLKLFEEAGNKISVAKNIGNIGGLYEKTGDYDKALEYDLKSLKIWEETGDKNSIGILTLNIGIVYKDQGNYPKALEYYFKALGTAEETGNKLVVAAANGTIGSIYAIEQDYPKALEYYLKELKTDEAAGNKQGMSAVLNNIGGIYQLQSNYAVAMEYCLKSLKIDEEAGIRQGIALDLGNLGTLYNLQKNYEPAIENYQAALKISGEIGDKKGVANDLSNIGQCFLSIYKDTLPRPAAHKSDIDELTLRKYIPTGLIPTGKAALLRNAIDYLQRGLAMCKEINTLDLMQTCYEHLAEASRINGDYKKALEYADNYRAIKDSLYSKENNEKILKLGLSNEYVRQRLADSLKTVARERISQIQLERQRSYTYMGFAGIALLIGFSFFIVKERGKSEQERKKSDELLLNILPGEVANELKLNGNTKARHYDNVTVLFTDFVNFTSAGERMSPQALIDELHTCFKKFDELTGKYNIEKIKTIGDAYLAVGGLPSPDNRHAENIVRAAIEINSFMEDRLAKLGTKTFEVRIGIHSGSLVAGIVGVKKFAYDIWGDTVNTAARMEQSSESGRINISQTTYELVKDKFSCTYRGEIDAKNKGGMKMYFVEAPKINASTRQS